ncbi:MAG: chemotaxis protein CheX [Candidatus Scalindua sp.]|nr:chemotaxis protein CheX [Candidatus Scalindua sp.]
MNINELEEGITNAIKASTGEVFTSMLMMEVKAEDSFVRDEKNVSTDLISSLHFFGENYMGKIAVFSSGAVACHIANAMLGSDTKEVNSEIKDGMGEIVNMIAGSAKVKLFDALGDIHLLTPWVIAGRHLTITSSDRNGSGELDLALDAQAQFSWVMTKFTFEHGSFMVGVQPNAVPEENKNSHGNKFEYLQEENRRLKKEIEQLQLQLVNPKVFPV